MAFLLSKTSLFSRLQSQQTKVEDPFTVSRRGFHIELGAREKALLAEDPALKKFKSYKKGVWRVKRVGDFLTIVVVADVSTIGYFDLRINKNIGDLAFVMYKDLLFEMYDGNSFI